MVEDVKSSGKLPSDGVAGGAAAGGKNGQKMESLRNVRILHKGKSRKNAAHDEPECIALSSDEDGEDGEESKDGSTGDNGEPGGESSGAIY